MQRIVINLEFCSTLPLRMTFQSATAPQRTSCKRAAALLTSAVSLHAAHVAVGAKLQPSLRLSVASFYCAFSCCLFSSFLAVSFRLSSRLLASPSDIVRCKCDSAECDKVAENVATPFFPSLLMLHRAHMEMSATRNSKCLLLMALFAVLLHRCLVMRT